MSSEAISKKLYVHLVSDATGTTLQGLARAALSQFEDIEPEERYWPLIRTEKQLAPVLDDIKNYPGPVLYTFVDKNLRRILSEHCYGLDLPCVAVLDPLLRTFSSFTGQQVKGVPGLQHVMDENYFKRVDAIDFALGFDDGQSYKGLDEADVILIGVSRTSKTPTCVYLARRGIKAANIPFVPHQTIPEQVLGFEKPLYVGLTESPDRLLHIRTNRIKVDANQQSLFGNAYIDPEAIEEEVANARKFFRQHNWPVIDVTKRSVEETAAEIMVLLQRRVQQKKEGQTT